MKKRFLAGLLGFTLLVLTGAPVGSAEILEGFMVYRAIDALCQYWIQGTEKLDVRGYLEVKNTRVIYLCDPLPEGELYEKAFGDTV